MIAAIIQARAGSARLPGKVLLQLQGRAMLARQIERVRRAAAIDRLLVATSEESSDDATAAVAVDCGVAVHRGSLTDVLGRMCAAARSVGADHVVRLTGDCPLSDPAVIDRVVGEHLASGADYTSNTLVRTYPDGLDVEVLTMRALVEADDEARAPADREHVTPFVYRQPGRYRLHSVQHSENLGNLRWAVDTAVDFALVERVFAQLWPIDPEFGMAEVLAFMNRQCTEEAS